MSKSELLSHRYCTMQSKFSRQHLLSSKTIFIAAPCLIGITAIAALLTSMSMERSGLSSATSNALPTASQVPQSIPATPITPQSPIAASPLTNSTPSPQAFSPRKTSASRSQSTPQRVTQSQSKAPVFQAHRSSLATKAQPAQTALSMQAFSSTAANEVPQVPIRVGIVHDAQSFTVATSEPGLITDSAGQVLKNVPAQSSVGVFASSGGLQIDGIQASNSVWIRTKSQNGLVFLDGKWYRGFVQLIPDQGRLLAVNHLEMQPYLYSVVGSEMFHDWPLEALKAQAIAARSYALVHIIRPASPHFDLGSTQRWQAYKGVNSEAKSVLTAVNETNGIVISHKGGVVESLYASSAELVRDAHKGFGMSQYGARDLASQNLNYRQILGRFYPGTELSLLQIQQ
jgi:stage II sporulation protein D